MRWEVGPVLRTLRRQPGVLAMMILQIAAGVATLTALLLSGSWYGRIGALRTELDEEHLLLVSTYTPGADEAAVAATQAADLARVRALAGVQAAAPVSTSILDERWTYPAVFKAGGREAVGWPVLTDAAVTRTLGLRVLAGAVPEGGDAAAAPALLLSKCLADRLFGGATAAPGKTVASDQTPPAVVRAVVADVRMRIPFMPHAKCAAFVLGEAPLSHEARLMVRAAPERRDAVQALLGATFADAAPARWVDVKPLDLLDTNHHRIGHGLVRLLSFFGVLVGLIALLGVLGATSFLVAQRTPHIGIRRALGATKADIVGYFFLENGLTTLLGSLIGLGGTALLTLMMRPVFQGLVVDVGLLGGGVLGFWLATLAATLAPALRAARVSPSVASRSL